MHTRTHKRTYAYTHRDREKGMNTHISTSSPTYGRLHKHPNTCTHPHPHTRTRQRRGRGYFLKLSYSEISNKLLVVFAQSAEPRGLILKEGHDPDSAYYSLAYLSSGSQGDLDRVPVADCNLHVSSNCDGFPSRDAVNGAVHAGMWDDSCDWSEDRHWIFAGQHGRLSL